MIWCLSCTAVSCRQACRSHYKGVSSAETNILFLCMQCANKTHQAQVSEMGFPILEENANLTGVVFLYTLAVKLQASRLANQACQILTMGWLEQVIPGLPWNGQHGRLPWWFKASLMKDLIQCKHLAKEYTESPMGEEHRLKLPC